MKLYLSSDSPNILSAEIVAVIHDLYPIGLTNQTPGYDKHPKVKRIIEAVNTHMEDYASYIKPWKSFLENLPEGHKSKVRNDSFAHDISYSGELTLDKYESASLIHLKKIVFSVSWLANYFTIYGIDETFIKDNLNGRDIGYPAVNVVTVSPYKEFESGFDYLNSAVSSHFPNHKFVRYNVCQSFVNDLHTLYGNNECTVHNALFNHMLDNVNTPYSRGDNSYGAGSSNITVTLSPPPPIK